MNYKSIYWSIILNRLDNPYIGYTEKHHILPTSIGGDNSEENLVRLSAKEHYICHHLLTKMYAVGSTEHGKMLSAFVLMLSTRTNKKITAAGFSKLREEFSSSMRQSQLGELNSQYGTIWINCASLQKEIKHNKTLPIPIGWEIGRFKPITDIQRTAELTKISNVKKRELNTLNNIQKYTSWYIIYDKEGYNKFVEITGYTKSKPNLVRQFAKYAVGYIPQNGKPRGTR